MTAPRAFDEWTPWIAARTAELAAGMQFLTRLPLHWHRPPGGPAAPTAPHATVGQAVWTFPLAGFVVGLIAALVYALAHGLILFSWLAAALTIAATLAVTGCMHEDGLADTADGFGGGATRDEKLAIMRDSRIGTFGVCALIISVLIRVDAIASLTDPGLVAAALIAAHAGARAAMAPVMFFVAPARSEGLSFSAGQPDGVRATIAAALGFLFLLFCLGPLHALLALVLLAILLTLFARLSQRQIGGQTGDVLGAVEQISEALILLVAVR